MKIAVVADLLRPNGAGIMAIEQARILSESCDITLVGGSAPVDPLESAADRVNVVSFTQIEGAIDRPLRADLDRPLRETMREWLFQTIDDINPDIVSAHNVGRMLDQTDVAALSRRYPVAMTLHDEWMYCDSHYVIPVDGEVDYSFEPHRSQSPSKHDFRQLWRVNRLAGRLVLVAPSRWIQDRAASVFTDVPSVHVNNPVDASHFEIVERQGARDLLGIDPNAVVVGFVGDPLSRRKNFELLSEAVATLKDGEVDALLVVGGGRSFVGSRAREFVQPSGVVANALVGATDQFPRLGLAESKSIVVSGIERSKVPLLVSAMDLVVHPSLADNLPTVPIESGLAGVRCIASNVGGTSESVAEQDGLFELPITPAALGARIATEAQTVRSESPERAISRREASLRFATHSYRDQIIDLFDWMVGADA